jgi:hypothetical protein
MVLEGSKRFGLRNLSLRLKHDAIAAPVASNPQRDHRDPQQQDQPGQKRAKPSTHAPQHEAESYHASRLNEL